MTSGTAYRIARPTEAEATAVLARNRAVQHFRFANPSTLSAGDPWAFRTVILRLHIGQIEGRAAVAG
jgi:hypothetical protein